MAKVRAAGPEVTGHDVLKTAPRGYPKDLPRIELLRFKGLIAWREWPAGPLAGNAASQESTGRAFLGYQTAQPMAARARRSHHSVRATALAHLDNAL